MLRRTCCAGPTSLIFLQPGSMKPRLQIANVLYLRPRLLLPSCSFRLVLGFPRRASFKSFLASPFVSLPHLFPPSFVFLHSLQMPKPCLSRFPYFPTSWSDTTHIVLLIVNNLIIGIRISHELISVKAMRIKSDVLMMMR